MQSTTVITSYSCIDMMLMKIQQTTDFCGIFMITKREKKERVKTFVQPQDRIPLGF